MLSILPTEYLAHHMLLVEAVHTLLQYCITTTMISKAEKLIQHYCFKFQFYYSERYMTANVHYLLHLPEAVRNLGPLYTYSCFPYEGTNGLTHIAGQHLAPDTEASRLYRSMKAQDMNQTS